VTLYHGTTVDNEASIKQFGLMGGVGSFVEQAYGGYKEELPDIVFAADKQGLGKAVGAMAHHIGKKLGKYMNEVTDNDILNQGLLVVIHDIADDIEQRPRGDKNYYGQYPPSVEPGDYFSEKLRPDKFVKGRALLRLLERYGEWPREWGGSQTDETARVKKMRGELTAFFLKKNPERTKQEIMNKINSLSNSEVMWNFKEYLGWGWK
jgi:hypothetical protein